jgi:beta-xylosidase
VLDADFPDPFVVHAGQARYVAFSTNSAAGRIPVAESTDALNWHFTGDALPTVPSWASNKFDYWAPTVVSLGNRWLLYFTGPDRASGRQCIGVASAARLEGPYEPEAAPIACQSGLGGSIDPDVYFDDRGSWLLWKSNGNCCGAPSWIWSQRLSADGLHVEGEASRLLTDDQAWERTPSTSERSTVEGPFMISAGGLLYLFYSANGYATADYGVGYAICSSPTGPCTKPRSTPLLASVGPVAGPGGASVFEDEAGDRWLAYHAWDTSAIGYPAGRRALHIDRLSFAGTTPVVDGPSAGDVMLHLSSVKERL